MVAPELQHVDSVCNSDFHTVIDGVRRREISRWLRNVAIRNKSSFAADYVEVPYGDKREANYQPSGSSRG